MKLFAMQSYPVSYHFLPLRPNFISERPIFQIPSTYILPLVSETKFHTHIKHWQYYSLLLYFNLCIPNTAYITEISSPIILLSPTVFFKDPFPNMILHENFVSSAILSVKFGCPSHHPRISSF